MICKRRQTCIYYGTSRTRIRDICRTTRQDAVPVPKYRFSVCFEFGRIQGTDWHLLYNDSCIAWDTSILHFLRIQTKNHLPAEHGIRKHLQEISRRLDDDMTSILTILGIGSLLISDCPFTWCASTCLSKSHSASMAAKCAHQAEIVLAQRLKDRSKW